VAFIKIRRSNSWEEKKE